MTYDTQVFRCPLISTLILLLLAKVELAERLAESDTVNSLLHLVRARAVDLANSALAISVDDETEQVRTHVVATEVIEGLAEVGLVKVDVDVDEAFEVLCGLGDQTLTVWAIDASVAVVHGVVLGGLAWRSLESNTCRRDGLEGCESERASLDGVSRSDDIGVGIADIGVRVRILECGGVRVQRPCGNVDLLALRNGVCLEEGVHVLPAVEVANSANLGVHDHVGGVTSTVAEDETLNVCGADLAAVVDDVAGRVDHDLGGVETVQIHFAVSQRNKDGVLFRSSSDTVHLRRIGRQRSLTVFLQERKALLVVDLPHPVRVTGNP